MPIPIHSRNESSSCVSVALIALRYFGSPWLHPTSNILAYIQIQENLATIFMWLFKPEIAFVNLQQRIL